MVRTDEQLDRLEAEICDDGEDQDDDLDPLDRTISSLFQLEQRCQASHATETGRRIAVEAQLEACVAAETLTGETFHRPEAEWLDALQALQGLQRAQRAETIGRRINRSDTDDLQAAKRDGRWNAACIEADAILVERIDWAIRRWEQWVAEPDTNRPEGETMTTATATKRTTRPPAHRDSLAHDPLPGIVVNEHGVVTRGAKTMKVPIRKTTRCAIEIEVAQVRSGEWWTGRHLECRDAAHSAGVSAQPQVFASEEEALVCEFATAREFLDAERRREPKHAGAIYKAIEDLEAHRRKLGLPDAPAVTDGIPETESEAAAKEASVDETFQQWRSRLGELVELGHLAGPLNDRLLSLYADGESPEGAVERLRGYLTPLGNGQLTTTDQPPATQAPRTFDKWRAELVAQLDLGDPVVREINDDLLDLFHSGRSVAEAIEALRQQFTEAWDRRTGQATAGDAAAESERVVLTFSKAARAKAMIDLRPAAGCWHDRLSEQTHWKPRKEQGCHDRNFGEHVIGKQRTREEALATALDRLREAWEGVDDQYLSAAGRKARPIALRELAAERERILGATPAAPAETTAAISESTDSLSDSVGSITAASQQIDVERIDLRDDNPRGPAREEEILAKMTTLEREGQLSPIGLLATSDGRYELWWGERRYLAARRLQWPTIRADVFAAGTDLTTLAGKRAAENLYQEDLDPIQRARHLDALLRSLGWDPEDSSAPSLRSLAKQIGISQGELSNTLGLLKLPAEWQQKLIAREITPTQGRMLIPWVERPAVLKDVAREHKQHGGELSTGEFERLVRRSVKDLTRPVDKGSYFYFESKGQRRSGHCLFTPKLVEQHADELDVVTLVDGRHTERRAFNVQRWAELHGNLEAQAAEREAKRSSGQAAKAKGREPTPEELQAKARQQQKQLEQKVARYKRAWLQQRIAARVVDESGAVLCSTELLLKLLLYFTTTDRRERDEELGQEVRRRAGKTKQRNAHWVDVWPTLSTLKTEPGQFTMLAAQLVVRWLTVNAEGYHAGIRTDDIPAIAAELGVDLKTEWRVDQAFLELFTKDQLAALAREWKVGMYLVNCGDKRADQIATLLTVDKAAWKVGMHLVNCGDKRADQIAALLTVDKAAAKKLPAPKILQKAK